LKPIKKIFPLEKTDLHPRNKHKFRYDFDQLCQSVPELSEHKSLNKFGDKSIDFSNQKAVRLLNQSLLKYFYNINYWEIPENYLCPPIPGRADYVHYIADLLGYKNNENINGQNIKGLDIGVGANCIYPIICNREYGWKMIGADINLDAIKSANNIISNNENLNTQIEIRQQLNNLNFFKGIIDKNEHFNFSICNPPFHSSIKEVEENATQKWKGLGKKTGSKLNFGGQDNELWCKGGEKTFITNMIIESVDFQNSIDWFTSLVSKSENLKSLLQTLNQHKVKTVKTIEMKQGQKISRILAWSFIK
jgi:23S rRNA (adenine1618-N6)-methyltransferase